MVMDLDFDFNLFLERLLKTLHLVKKDNIRRFNLAPNVFDTIIRAFMSFLLLGTDFILFIGSGNFNIFKNGVFSSEVLTILLLFALLSMIIYALFAKYRIIQDGLVAVTVFVFMYSLYNQFAQFDFHGFLAEWLSLSPDGLFGEHSEIIVSCAFAAATFYFYYLNKRYHILIATAAIFMIFIGVMLNKFMHLNSKDEFIVVFNNQQQIISADKDDGQKAIYLFFPEASSYKTIAKWTDLPETQATIDKILAFYAKNRFTLYSNAYVENNEQYMNLIAALNSQRGRNINDNILNTKMLYRYWKFFNLIDEYIYLQNSDLIETYNNSGYKTTAYKSRIVDLCTKKHRVNVNRCVEKIGTPTNIYGKNINLSEKTKIILAEWLESLKLIGNMSGLYKMFSIFSDVDKTPLVGINYSNLYVINSIYAFDKLFEDISSDKGNQAYFAFIDLPADMYIYNEFCEIKPTSQWISLNDLPWMKSKNHDLKKKAYMQQTQCLYGKLEEFMQKLKDSGLINHTSIMIQGTSSFVKNDYNAPFVDNFINSKTVNMAYKEENQKYFSINDSICNTSNIINSVLYGSKTCEDLEGVNAHISIKKDIYNELNKYDIEEDYLQKAVNDFNEWFKVWKMKNSNPNIVSDDNDLILQLFYNNKEENRNNADFVEEFEAE